MEIELKLQKEELQYLYTVLKDLTPQPLEDEVKLYKSTFDAVEHQMIANEIFNLLNDLDELADDKVYFVWENKLWSEVPDGDGIIFARDRKLWTWETVSEMKALVEELKNK